MLQLLLSRQTDAELTANLTLLARMNTVRRLSSLLCPDFVSVNEDQYSVGMQLAQHGSWMATYLRDIILASDVCQLTQSGDGHGSTCCAGIGYDVYVHSC